MNMKKLSRKNVLRNEIPGQMSIEDFPEYLPESYSRGQMSRAEVRRRKRENEKKAKTFVMTAEELQKVRLQEREKVKQERSESVRMSWQNKYGLCSWQYRPMS